MIAEALGYVSDDAVWRVMRKHDLHLDRRQSWCVSTDPEFSRKASEIVGLYLKPPENAIVLRFDEKPNIQALKRAQGYIRLPSGRAVTGFAHEYERHGTMAGHLNINNKFFKKKGLSVGQDGKRAFVQ